MGLSLLAVSAVGTLSFVIYKFLIYPIFLSPLSKIPPAHPSCHVSQLWLYYIKWSNVKNNTLYELHRTKGPILRLAPNELSVNCYEGGLKTIYTGGFEKPEWYGNAFSTCNGVTNMFSMMDSKSHSQRKRMLSNVYAKSSVLSSPTNHETTKTVLYDRYLPIFQASAEKTQPVEMLGLGYAYSMDAFTVYQMGLSLGTNFIQNVKEREWYLHKFFIRRPFMFWPNELPKFTAFLQRLGISLIPKFCDLATAEMEQWYLGIQDKAENLLSTGVAASAADMPVVYAHERTAMRRVDKDPKTLTDPIFLQIAQPYPRRLEIASDMLCQSAAAIETSGDTLTYLYYELSRRPALQAQLRKELLTLAHPLKYPLLEGHEITLPDFKAVDNLALLDAVLQETLRLWPAVPGGQPRVTPSPSCTLAGYRGIPAGVRVQASAYALHRNPEVFPDPEAWRPERWLDAQPQQLAEMRRWFWAFSSGGRMCIGSNFAIHSMKFATASIYTNYTSSIVEAPDMEQAEGYTAGPKGGKLVLQYQHV